MQYRTVKETALAWGISKRQVQRYIQMERIPGVERIGRSFLVPSDAKKPSDQRQTHVSSDYVFPYLRITEWTPIGKAPSFEDINLQTQYEAEIACLKGNYKQAKAYFDEVPSEAPTKLCSASVSIVASIADGDYVKFREIEAYLARCKRRYKHCSPETSLFCELILNLSAVSMYAPNMASSWLKSGDFPDVPEGVRAHVLYLYGRYLHGLDRYQELLSLSKSTVFLSNVTDGFYVQELYFRLLCAISYASLSQKKEAKKWLLSAMDLALPLGLIGPFAETLTPMLGLTEECLLSHYPKYYEKVILLWERTWKNWMTFHNLYTKDNITLILSLREYEIAALLSKQVPISEIAQQFGLSDGRVRNIIQEIYQKLMINNRKQLKECILWNQET